MGLVNAGRRWSKSNLKIWDEAIEKLMAEAGHEVELKAEAKEEKEEKDG